nr:hypothetical protein Ade03nite_59410 [Actinoplanes derwentensis]
MTALLTQLATDNNKANSTLNASAVGLYEVEAALAMDQASLNTTPADFAIKPFTYNAFGSQIPGELSGADFFVVESRTSFGGAIYPLVMVKSGSDWRLGHYVGLNAALPEIRRDASGNAEIVGDTDSGGTLLASPRDVAAAHARQITDKPSPDPLFGGDTTTTEIVNSDALLTEMTFVNGSTVVPAESVTYTSTVSTFPIRALRTADGGAAVAYSTITDVVGTNAGRKVFIPQRRRTLGTNTGGGTQTMKRLSVWWALIPVKDSGLPVAVLGGSSTIIEVG